MEKIEPTITLSPERIAGGETVLVRMSSRKVSKPPVNLYFTAHQGPMTRLMVADEGPVIPDGPFECQIVSVRTGRKAKGSVRQETPERRVTPEAGRLLQCH